MPAESDKRIREKISGMDVLPAGLELNSAARWQQIERALQPIKKRTAKWYYAAAVCLGIAVTLLVLNKDHEQPAVNSMSKNLGSPVKPIEIVAQKTAIIKKNTVGSIHLKKAAASNNSLPIIIPDIQRTNTPDPRQTVTVIESPANLIPVKPTIIAAHKEPVKPKRLKIVHLNELGNEQEMIYTRTPSKKMMQVMDELPDEQATPQSNKAWWQLKPKPVVTITDHP